MGQSNGLVYGASGRVEVRVQRLRFDQKLSGSVTVTVMIAVQV